MDCKTVKELLREYVDKELDEEKESQIREHLLECSDCRKELNTILSLDNALKSVINKFAKPSEEFLQKIKERFSDTLSCFYNFIYPEEEEYTIRSFELIDSRTKHINILGGKKNGRKRPSEDQWKKDFYNKWLNKACALTGNDEDGKDLFWETCLTIEKYENTFDMNCSNPDHWILKIMVNLWSQEYNRKKNTISLDSKYTNEYGEKYTIDYPDDENLEIKIDSDELRLDVKRVLSELPDDERLALVLADLEEKDHQEAAKIVGMSLKDFRNLRKRAVRHIRQAFLEK